MAKKKYGIDMTADEWFEIEDNGIGGEWTMEDVAKLGPEGREFHRNAPYNPYFPKPDMSIFDEDLYDGYKIKEKKWQPTNGLRFEERGMCEDWTMEEVAAMGPEGRDEYRNAPVVICFHFAIFVQANS